MRLRRALIKMPAANGTRDGNEEIANQRQVNGCCTRVVYYRTLAVHAYM